MNIKKNIVYKLIGKNNEKSLLRRGDKKTLESNISLKIDVTVLMIYVYSKLESESTD